MLLKNETCVGHKEEPRKATIVFQNSTKIPKTIKDIEKLD